LRIFLDLRTVRPGMTGVGIAAHLVWDALLSQPCEGEVAGLFLKSCAPPASSDPHVTLIETGVDYESHPRGDLWFHMRLPRIAGGWGADVFHGAAFQIPWLPTPFAKTVSIHDMIAFRHPGTMPFRFRNYLRFVTRLSARSSDRIVTCSGATACDIAEILSVDTSKIDVVPLYPRPVFRPVSPDESDSASRFPKEIRKPFILCAGTLEHRKNQELLVRAFGYLTHKGAKGCQLILAGGRGDGFDGIAAAIRDSGASNDIIIVERPDDSLLRTLYCRAELFVLPSLYEGFGLTLLEAMACGAPVLHSDAASLPEVAGGAGAAFISGNLESLVQAMDGLLRDKARRSAMRSRSLSRAAEFTPERTAVLLWNAYARAVK